MMMVMTMIPQIRLPVLAGKMPNNMTKYLSP